MKPVIRSFCLTLAAMTALHGCGGEEAQVPEASSRPVKTFLVAGADGGAMRSFPGRVDSTNRADLAFRVPGTVQDILVKEGDLVEQGQLLARLDPTDYETVVKDRQATFDNSERNFQRARELVKDGFISGTEYDRLEANFKTSEAALAAARQVKINLPESVMRSLRPNPDAASAREEGARISSYVTFEGKPDQPFPLTLREVSTRADPKTQAFEVTFNMPAPTDFIVLPGMTATVTIDFGSRQLGQNESHWVPVNAVVADSGLGARVWVLDPQSMTVNSHDVEIGDMEGDRIEITSGLGGGEEIVAVGASYLAEGMRVSRMATSEQAVPRSGDTD
jgi:multidrug efflux pump subunit AcrA (membrane-fusion protein)